MLFFALLCKSRKYAFLDQRGAKRDPIVEVDRKHIDSRPSNRGQPDQQRTVPFEMIAPAVLSRMVKPRDLVAVRVKPRQVCPFVVVAGEAGQREIFLGGWTAVLPWNDVLDLKRQFIEFLRQSAVLAAIFCARPNQLPQRGVQILRGLIEAEACFGLHERNQMPDAFVAVDLLSLRFGELSFSSLLGKFVHRLSIAGGKAKPENRLGGVRFERWPVRRNDSR